ncbi:transcription factor bHLH110-like isoform X3 [Durio zibethinus]|uniref:Transcription factor bHLH110-like isoform X3 n=1 Tax=Durio zibethinus TaxID=66656 RepID=A0A6P6AW25_DURZI|nr:transcription factor bHLH110-like isoform X3 [Durio zibethinus]
MEPENVHHQHQLQDQLVGSSSLPIPPSYGVASSTHSWTPTSSSIILNTSEFIPVYNGDISHSMQKNSILAYSSQNSSMIQDWTNNEGSFATHSCHDIHLAKIKEELSESLTRFTEMLSDTSSRDVGDSRQLPPTNYLKNNEQKDLHDLSEKLLLKTISSGFPMFSAGSEFYSTTQNCSIPGSTCLPSRRNFSQIYPSINISNLSQASSPNIPSSFDMNLEALDLLSPARFSSRSSFTNPSRDHNNLGIYKEISPSFGFHHHHFQQSNQRPAYSPSKQVRKEKLGDRIAALQQLVAPFGKTDTASVLMEAIGYIKFLQNQVETLSVPYMKSYRNKTSRSKQGGSTMEEGNEEEAKRDLRSRGLCLVPLSCMSYVTNDSGGSIWPPPNFTGGTYNNNC